MKTEITALPVERDESGYWTHPAYSSLCAEREHVPIEEFDTWLNHHGLEWSYNSLECSEDPTAIREYELNGSFAKWHPIDPGYGWFVGSIHDSEDGPVCIWLRNKVAL